MSGSPGEQLPDFERPPVSEVALGVQFAPLPLRAIDLGPLRDIWSAEYPTIVEQPPLDPLPEDPALGPTSVISFGPPPMMRHWWINRDESQLLQVQRDRLILNWRRMAAGSVYPRYPALRADFRRHLEQFAEFAGVRGYLRCTHAEVTYINDLGSDGGPVEDTHRLVRLWAPVDDHHLGRPLEVRFAAAFAPKVEAPNDRLLVSLDPTMRPDGAKTSLLTLTYRGRTAGEAIEDAMDLLDRGRQHIVRSFTELTAAPMHQRWGRV